MPVTPGKFSEFVDTVVNLGEPLLVKAGMTGSIARQLLHDALVEVSKLPLFRMRTIYVPKLRARTIAEALATEVGRKKNPSEEAPIAELVDATTKAISARLLASGASDGEAARLAVSVVFSMWDVYQATTLYIAGVPALSRAERDAALWAEYNQDAGNGATRPRTHARLLAMAARHGYSDRGLYKLFRRHRAALQAARSTGQQLEAA